MQSFNDVRLNSSVFCWPRLQNVSLRPSYSFNSMMLKQQRAALQRLLDRKQGMSLQAHPLVSALQLMVMHNHNNKLHLCRKLLRHNNLNLHNNHNKMVRTLHL